MTRRELIALLGSTVFPTFANPFPAQMLVIVLRLAKVPNRTETRLAMRITTRIAQELANPQLNVTGLVAAAAIVFCAADGRLATADAAMLNLPRAAGVFFVQTEGAPKTEIILRKTIQELQEGKPDFQSMEPELQKAVQGQSAHTADIYRHLGSLQTLKYIGTRDGTDMYRAVYQNAAVTYTIRLSPSGKISALLLQPAFPWE